MDWLFRSVPVVGARISHRPGRVSAAVFTAFYALGGTFLVLLLASVPSPSGGELLGLCRSVLGQITYRVLVLDCAGMS